MHLAGPDGSFDLTLVGYQFPHLASAPWDSNWLQVRVAVQHRRGSWTATDPCLLTYEVAGLADWLEALASGSAADPEQSFLEPCLRFEVQEGPRGQLVLQACFEHELRPPWAQDLEDENASLTLLTEPDVLRAAAADLRGQLAKYPQRTER